MKLSSDEIQSKLTSLLEEYETLSVEVANAKAEFNKWEDLEDSTIAVIASNVQGESEAERKRSALRTQKYQLWLDSINQARLLYLTKKAREDYVKTAVEVYRSLLSFAKTSIDLHT